VVKVGMLTTGFAKQKSLPSLRPGQKAKLIRSHTLWTKVFFQKLGLIELFVGGTLCLG